MPILLLSTTEGRLFWCETCLLFNVAPVEVAIHSGSLPGGHNGRGFLLHMLCVLCVLYRTLSPCCVYGVWVLGVCWTTYGVHRVHNMRMHTIQTDKNTHMYALHTHTHTILVGRRNVEPRN